MKKDEFYNFIAKNTALSRVQEFLEIAEEMPQYFPGSKEEITKIAVSLREFLTKEKKNLTSEYERLTAELED